MQAEWNKWLNVLTSFKEGQGMLLIFCLLSLAVFWQKADRKQQKLLCYSAGMGLLVLCPVTAAVLLKGYTPFYDWFDLQLLMPVTLLLAFGGTELVCGLQKMEVPGLRLKRSAKTIISLLCVAVLLMSGTTFHAFDSRSEADSNGVPAEVSEVLEPLHDIFADKPLTIAAPSGILLYTRLYEADWQPLYGRDLWSPKAASYINSGYDIEYEYYEFLEKEQLDEEEFAQLTDLIIEGPAECVIVPTEWIGYMGQLTDCVPVNLTDSYTGIIKKDLMKE